jgi:hypothetical protein
MNEIPNNEIKVLLQKSPFVAIRPHTMPSRTFSLFPRDDVNPINRKLLHDTMHRRVHNLFARWRPDTAQKRRERAPGVEQIPNAF